MGRHRNLLVLTLLAAGVLPSFSYGRPPVKNPREPFDNVSGLEKPHDSSDQVAILPIKGGGPLSTLTPFKHTPTFTYTDIPEQPRWQLRTPWWFTVCVVFISFMICCARHPIRRSQLTDPVVGTEFAISIQQQGVSVSEDFDNSTAECGKGIPFDIELMSLDKLALSAQGFGGFRQLPPNLQDFLLPSAGSPCCASSNTPSTSGVSDPPQSNTTTVAYPQVGSPWERRSDSDEWAATPVVLGRGAHGVVHQGYRVSTGEPLALKYIPIPATTPQTLHPVIPGVEVHPGEAGEEHGGKVVHPTSPVQMLLREISWLSTLDHTNIVKYKGCCRIAECAVIATEYMAGGSLASLCRNRRLALPTLRKFLVDILRGLDYLHGNNIIHMDVKPSNLLVDATGTCKLADFDLARIASTATSLHTVVGTPLYMAPEAIRGFASKASDIWAVGITTIEMSTGMQPWRFLKLTAPHALMFRIANGTPHPIPSCLSAAGQDFVQRCLMPDPLTRPTCAELLVHPFLSGLDTSMDYVSTDKARHAAYDQQCAIVEPTMQHAQQPPLVSSPALPTGSVFLHPRLNSMLMLKSDITPESSICTSEPRSSASSLEASLVASSEQHNYPGPVQRRSRANEASVASTITSASSVDEGQSAVCLDIQNVVPHHGHSHARRVRGLLPLLPVAQLAAVRPAAPGTSSAPGSPGTERSVRSGYDGDADCFRSRNVLDDSGSDDGFYRTNSNVSRRSYALSSPPTTYRSLPSARLPAMNSHGEDTNDVEMQLQSSHSSFSSDEPMSHRTVPGPVPSGTRVAL